MADTRETLGEVTVPSGTLVLVDPGTIGLWLNRQIERVPALTLDGLPTDRALAIVGVRVTEGDYAGGWDHVAVAVSDAAIARREPIGELLVDFARVLVADKGCASAWVHDRSIDGLADFAFWGRDAEALAAATGAPALEDGQWGWTDLPVDEAIARGTAARELAAARGWKLATDYRPHSHHWQALALVRASPTESGTIDVGGLRVCLFMTSWGDGMFPVYADRDADGGLVQVRIQLWTDDTEAAMDAVNR